MGRIGNTFKTFFLFVVLWAVVLGLGYLVASGTGNVWWIAIFCGVGLISTFWTYWNSATIALRQMRAIQVTRDQAPGLYAIVEELSNQMDMPMPTIWIAPTATPNAFATGRNPSNAAVCCTEGILRLLSERELRAVLGHELMHVYNRDILSASVAAALGGMVSSLAQLAYLSGARNRNGNALVGLIAMIAAPIAAALIQMGISRSREYSADADGALLTGDPAGLASALRRIESGVAAAPMQATPENENASALMIANPFRGGGMKNLFSTHPPMDDRIARLEQQAAEMGLPFS